MTTALIGYTGFVGSSLLRQTNFDCVYRSTDIQAIERKKFDTIICAGAPAQKWIANREPTTDLQKIENLINPLRHVKCKTFILISTVDVFKNPIAVNEDTPLDQSDLHPYGNHRLMLEEFVRCHFSNTLIVRFPGLVGPGLRKNILFDILNKNNLEAIDSRSVFQFYPMVNLWRYIEIALAANLKLVHFTAEPIQTSVVFQMVLENS